MTIVKLVIKKPFLKPSGDTPDVSLIKKSTLRACVRGLSKRIVNAKTIDERSRLKMIREEIKFLINNL